MITTSQSTPADIPLRILLAEDDMELARLKAQWHGGQAQAHASTGSRGGALFTLRWR